jgi:O-antigen/teichoic acid export membrane protein
MKCSVASAGINVVINFMLIPKYGMIGAAIGTAVSYASIEVLMTLRTWKKQNMHPFTSMYRKLTLIVVFLVGSMLAAKDVHLITGANWEYATFIAGYFLIVHRARVLDNTEMKMIGEIRKSIRYNISLRIPETLKTLAS